MGSAARAAREQPVGGLDALKARILRPAFRITRVDLGGTAREGEALYVRSLTGAEQRAYIELAMYEPDDEGVRRFKPDQEIRAQLLVRALCDEHGERIFTDDEAALLEQSDYVLLQRAYLAALDALYPGVAGSNGVKAKVDALQADPKESSSMTSPSEPVVTG